MSSARDEDESGGARPGDARSKKEAGPPSGPGAVSRRVETPASTDGRLLTSEDLFGDLVDAVSPVSPGLANPVATRKEPIKVQVSEPGLASKGAAPLLASSAEKLPADVAALLDAFSEPGEAAAREAPPEPPVPAAAVATAAVATPIAPEGPKAAGAKSKPRGPAGPSDVEPLLQILEELENEPEEEPLAADASEESLDTTGGGPLPERRASPPGPPPDEARAFEGLRRPPVAERPILEVTPVDEDPDGSIRAGLEDLMRLKLPVLSRRAAYDGGGELPGPHKGAKPTAAKFEARTAKPAGAPGVDLFALAQEALGQGGPFTGKRDERRRAPGGFGPYRLMERIALGGMAEVFKAKRTGVEGFEKILAVKRILPHLSDNKEFVDMFIAEAKMVAGLAHPNIVQIFDLGKIDKSYFIAMEYVHGRDLRSILRRARERGLRLPLDLSALIVSKVCSALEFAHRKKDERGRPMMIVHRDVSPQNILISFEGDVKLTDFGIAKAASKATVTDAGALRGKLLYMSPEQAWGKAMDRRSDLFSLALVFYEMITEERPFMSTSEMSILEMVRECKVAAPSSMNPRVPERLEKVVMKALQRDPEDRYQDAAEMYRDLERVLHERQPPAADALPRLMEVLFDDTEREDLRTRDASPEPEPEGEPEAEDGPQPADDAEGKAVPAASAEGAAAAAADILPKPPPPPAKDPMSLQKLLKRFGIK